jgi:hypothetical protein
VGSFLQRMKGISAFRRSPGTYNYVSNDYLSNKQS